MLLRALLFDPQDCQRGLGRGDVRLQRLELQAERRQALLLPGLLFLLLGCRATQQ